MRVKNAHSKLTITQLKVSKQNLFTYIVHRAYILFIEQAYVHILYTEQAYVHILYIEQAYVHILYTEQAYVHILYIEQAYVHIQCKYFIQVTKLLLLNIPRKCYISQLDILTCKHIKVTFSPENIT